MRSVLILIVLLLSACALMVYEDVHRISKRIEALDKEYEAGRQRRLEEQLEKIRELREKYPWMHPEV